MGGRWKDRSELIYRKFQEKEGHVGAAKERKVGLNLTVTEMTRKMRGGWGEKVLLGGLTGEEKEVRDKDGGRRSAGRESPHRGVLWEPTRKKN